jgi:hypothetical protein
MDFLEGQSLREVIRTFGRLFPKRALELARQIAVALQEAHEKGIVHRDLKPDNVMIVDRDDGERAVVTDFGLVHLVAGGDDDEAGPTRLTRTGVAYGTPHFMSPEQIAGDAIDARTDIYALGVVLFQMLTGEPPYDGENLARVMGQHITQPVPQLEERTPEVTFPDGLQELIERMMAKEPEDRPATAKEVIDAIDAVASGRKLNGAPTPTAEIGPAGEGVKEPEQGKRTRYMVLGLSALAAILLMSILCLTPFVFMQAIGDGTEDEEEVEAVAHPAEADESGVEVESEEMADESDKDEDAEADGAEVEVRASSTSPEPTEQGSESAGQGEAAGREAEGDESTREAIERAIREELPTEDEIREIFEVRESPPPGRGRGKGRGQGRSGRN